MSEILNKLKQELAETQAAHRASVNRTAELRVYINQVRAAIKMERGVERVVREDQKKLRAEKREERRAAQVAKLEARLAAMRSPKALRKAARKPSAVTTISVADWFPADPAKAAAQLSD